MKCSCYILRVLIASVALAVFGLQFGCETTGSSARSDGVIGINATNIVTATTFQPGDNLTLEFDNGLPTPWQQLVREEGSITLPLNKSVVAAGKKKGELEQEIQRIYVPNTLRRLTVNVRSQERSYFVRGEVRTPGQKPHTGLITAMKAIAAAGDFTDFAKRTDVTILRANGEKLHMNARKAMKDPAKYDVPVFPGDTVYVNRRFF
jgi:protein involved in polysaccharide export with SLBB domain